MMLDKLINDKKVLTIGRTYFENDLLFMNFSGSGIECNVSGNEINITFFATKYNEDNSRPYVSILVNDIRTDFALDEEYKTITIPLSSGVNNVKILKRTESNVSFVAIKDINVENVCDIEAKNGLNIEFYGDSLTCGFGNLATDPTLPFTTSTESFLDGYSYLLAKKLNANYSAVSVSGFPVYKSRWNQGFPIDSIADMISVAGYGDNHTFDTVPKWDNSKYVADLVVINLGSNDESFFSTGQDWVDELVKECGTFEEAQKHPLYVDHLDKLYKRILQFLQDLFKTYGPNLKVLYLLGMIDVSPWIYDAINKALKEFNNPNVWHYRLTGPQPNDVFGAVWHPGSKMHINTCEEVYKFIKENIL